MENEITEDLEFSEEETTEQILTEETEMTETLTEETETSEQTESILTEIQTIFTETETTTECLTSQTTLVLQTVNVEQLNTFTFLGTGFIILLILLIVFKGCFSFLRIFF